MEVLKKARGGKREGAGRKPSGTVYVKIRLTPEQKELLTTLGGSSYLQELLENKLDRIRKESEQPQ